MIGTWDCERKINRPDIGADKARTTITFEEDGRYKVEVRYVPSYSTDPLSHDYGNWSFESGSLRFIPAPAIPAWLGNSTALPTPATSERNGVIPLSVGDATWHFVRRPPQPKYIFGNELREDVELERRARMPSSEAPKTRESYARNKFLNENPRMPSDGEEKRPKIPAQAANSSSAKGKFVNSLGMEFVPIPAGQFQMGSPLNQKDRGAEELQHQVRLTRNFSVAIHEVTQEQYITVTGANPSKFNATAYPEPGENTGKRPVETISWLEAITFCNLLSQRESRPAFYHIAGNDVTTLGNKGYRLPTEAEWEYAARGGTESPFFWGTDVTKVLDYAWTTDNCGNDFVSATTWQKLFRDNRPEYTQLMESVRPRTHSVGQKLPNAFGLYDTQGNVWEWCWDRYSPTYYQESPSSDPQGPATGDERVMRGGSYGNWSGIGLGYSLFRTAIRDHRTVDSKGDSVGFRVVYFE